MSLLLGCVADDFTGATDLASTLVKSGMRTVQLLGVPRRDLPVPDSDAIVIALKSRSNAAEEAVMMSLAALDWLRQNGARQYFFKYCSTFDSTDNGNIGPVADAMLDVLDAPYTVFNPAFPTNKRTVFKGHLFVGDELLSDSGMRNHPLNPMTDSSLPRVLARQSKYKVGLVQYDSIVRGADAVREEMHQRSNREPPCRAMHVEPTLWEAQTIDKPRTRGNASIFPRRARRACRACAAAASATDA